MVARRPDCLFQRHPPRVELVGALKITGAGRIARLQRRRETEEIDFLRLIGGQRDLKFLIRQRNQRPLVELRRFIGGAGRCDTVA